MKSTLRGGWFHLFVFCMSYYGYKISGLSWPFCNNTFWTHVFTDFHSLGFNAFWFYLKIGSVWEKIQFFQGSMICITEIHDLWECMFLIQYMGLLLIYTLYTVPFKMLICGPKPIWLSKGQIHDAVFLFVVILWATRPKHALYVRHF